MADTPMDKRDRIKLKPQQGCTCLDKLVDEEKERHAKNIALQKILVKRLEASERRISFDGDDDDDDDDDDDETQRRRGKKRKAAAEKPTPVVQKPLPAIKPPKIKPVFDTDKCVCYKKIQRQERKRKKFVRQLERQQRKFEKNNLKAQKKYEKQRKKAFKKCDHLQEALGKKFGMDDKTVKIKQGDETYSVFLHMDPGECGCSLRERCRITFKKKIFKFCVWFYLFCFAIGGGVYYIVGHYN